MLSAMQNWFKLVQTTIRALLKATACIFFNSFFSATYVVERLIVQKINLLNKEILQFLGLKTGVSNQDQVIMARVQ